MAPTTILLMRHAQEPDDPKNPDLSGEGRTRANAFARYIPDTFGKPDFVFAAAVNKRSARAFLSMRPLCDAIAVPLDVTLKAKKYRVLATRLLSDALYADKLVLVCWTHTELPALANALEVRLNDYPDPWDESEFKLVLRLDYGHAGAPKVTRVALPV